MQEPEIILADEPIASLDPRNTKVVMDALLRINRHFGITVICNLHSLDLARGYCDRLIGMAAGQVVFDGTPEQLTELRGARLYGLEADVRSNAPAQPNGVPSMIPSWACRHRVPLLEFATFSGVARQETASPTQQENDHAQPPPLLSAGASRWPFRQRGPRRRLESEVPGTDVRGGAGRERLRRRPTATRRSWTICPRNSAFPVTLRIANDYAAVIEGQRDGNIQIAYYGPASYARAYHDRRQDRAVRHHPEQ